MSHPVRVRGLKRNNVPNIYTCHFVAPRAGAWIETWPQRYQHPPVLVAPRAGAWIETSMR